MTASTDRLAYAQRPEPKVGDVVELSADMEGGYCNEPVRLVRMYRRNRSRWWLAESLKTYDGFVGPAQYRFTEECIVEVNGEEIE